MERRLGIIIRSSWLTALSLLLLLSSTAAADDWQLWTEAGVRVKLSERFRLKVNQHLRIHEDVSTLEKIMPEAIVAYRAQKFLRIALGYRFIAELVERNDEGYIDTWHRAFLDAKLRGRWKPFGLDYRLRFQEQLGYPREDDGELKAKHTIRNKLSASWDVGAGFEPFVLGELFNRVDDPDGIWHKWRAGLGVDYELEDHDLTLSYRMEESLTDDPDNVTTHIVTLGYAYSF
jgi:Protein of unknown function (DUF2490)